VNRGSAAIVAYHSVSEGSKRFAISPAAFGRQIRYLRDQFQIIRLSEIRGALQQQHSNRPCVILTIDDGYVDFLENAYPVLSELGVPATVFVPTGLIGRTNEWEAGRGFPVRRIMDEGQLRRLASEALVDVGAHSVTHCNLRSLRAPQICRQVEESKAALERLLERPVTMFAYPYGGFDSFSAETARALHAAGYDIAVTTIWGTHQSPRDMLTLRRIFLNERDSADAIRRKVTGRHDWRRTRQRAGHLLAPVRRWAAGVRAHGIHRNSPSVGGERSHGKTEDCSAKTDLSSSGNY
jgi:peptidoglycan/xylan/chitin deacetylase (PgdA/CDA1 family)